ncbi:carbonic anhydrase [Holotrichia oblita]|uniref:Carbonic anhydrase n=1 Tax=Holotrichia oblita TaxID=644536 RepID=A0ACB9TSL0_HOLOL|nr:carbonic anhydrase [Holotrichia oblita]
MSTEWGYCQNNGPETWHKCFPQAAGARQSPVDIRSVNTKILTTNQCLSWRYEPGNALDISNTGYGWKVHVNGEGSELIGGPLEGKYVLEQFHCHWAETSDKGSEHTMNGRTYAGELHFVHWNASKYSSFAEAVEQPDGLAVLGIFLQSGQKSEEMEKIVSYLSQIQYKDQQVNIDQPIDPNLMIPKNSPYYTYLGSLTTPPCLECVVWIVFKDPLQVSEEQLEAFRELRSYSYKERCPEDEFRGYIKTNYRPTLPVGKREVKAVYPIKQRISPHKMNGEKSL